MTRLRQLMLEELERRNYSPQTPRSYLREVADFGRYFRSPPDQLHSEHIGQCQARLLRHKKLSPGSVTQHLAALRLFVVKTLKRSWSVAETPYHKVGLRLPTVLSQEEVAPFAHPVAGSKGRSLLLALSR